MKKPTLRLQSKDIFFCNLRLRAAQSHTARFFWQLRPLGQRISGQIRRLRIEFEQSLLLDAASRFAGFLLRLRLRVIGILLFSSGLWMATFHMVRPILMGEGAPEYSILLYAAISAGSALPLLCSKKTLAQGVEDSRIFSFLLFDLLGLYPDALRNAGRREHGGFTAFILGIAIGLVTLFVRPWYLLGAGLVLLCVAIIFRMPEAGLSLLVAVLPFAGRRMLLLLGGLSWASYLVKLLLGRRSLRFGPADGCLLAYGGAVLGGLLFPVSLTATVESGSWRLFAISIGLLALQLIRSGKGALRLSGILTASATATALVGLLLYGRQGFGQLLGGHGFPFSTAQMTSVFPTATAFGCYLLLLLPFLPAFSSCTGTGGHRVLLFLPLGCCGLCLALSWDIPAIVGAVFAMAIYLLLRKKKGWFGILLLVLVAVGCLLPSGIFDRLHLGAKLLRDMPQRWQILLDYGKAILPCLFVGAGSGSAAPAGLYQTVSAPALIGAAESGSFYMQCLAENGIVGLLLLGMTVCCVWMLCRSAMRMGFGFDREDGGAAEQLAPVTEETVCRRLLAAGCAALAGVLLGGLLTDPFALPSTELGFFLILGMTGGLAESTVWKKAVQLHSDRDALMLVCKDGGAADD